MTRHALALGAALLFCMAVPLAASASTPAAIYRTAITDSKRPADNREQDAARKPAETLAFAGVKPGQQVADFLPGGGYYSRLLSNVVGPQGHVYMLETTRWGADNIADTKKVLDEGRVNVSMDTFAFGAFNLPAPVDVFWTSRNYHDLLVKKYGDVDMAVFNKHVFDSLKPGGIYIVLDHSAMAGSGDAATATLHRIDQDFVKVQVEKAGFKFEGESPILHNTTDDRSKPIFDRSVQGHTDQFLLKFRKPA